MSKNITLKIDEALHRRARVLAAREGTSLSALVREFLESKLNAEEDHQERVLALKELYKKNHGKNKEPLTPLTRDEIYDECLPGH
jgi:plasmid stability protein